MVPPKLDFGSLERLTLCDVLPNARDDLTRSTVVEDMNGIQLLAETINDPVESAKQEKIDGERPTDSSLVKFAWGIDCEWQPGRDYRRDNPVATLQLSTRNANTLPHLSSHGPEIWGSTGPS